MTHRLFLGTDVSTTGAKALLIDETGGVVSSATSPLPLSTPRPLWSEQDPHDWWEGIVASIRRALADAGASGDDVAAVGMTGQIHLGDNHNMAGLSIGHDFSIVCLGVIAARVATNSRKTADFSQARP